jgi:hypothetical protein
LYRYIKVICAGIAITVASDEDDTPGEMVDGGVVATLTPLLRSDVLEVQEAAAATLGKLVVMSEKAALQCQAAGLCKSNPVGPHSLRPPGFNP